MSEKDTPIALSSPESRPIFRPAALRAFVERREETVVPRWVAPRFLRWLWALTAVSCLAAAPLLLVEVPVYAPALAILDGVSGDPDSFSVLIPADRAGEDLVGRRVLVGRSGDRDRPVAVVTAVRNRVLSPQAVLVRYGGLPLIAPGVAPPVVVADAAWEGGSPAWTSSPEAAGAWQPAEVEVVTRSAASLLRKGSAR